jgi:F-type H+-transporting ATPase subunit a
MENTQPAIQAALPFIVMFNFALAAALLIAFGTIVGKGPLTDDVPDGKQNLAEFVLSFFVGKAHDIGKGRVVTIVAPFLATCFLLIVVSNLFAVMPLPLLNYPPTAHFSVTLGLAISAVGGTLIISGLFNGVGGAIKHLFWPNPLQFISEVTDVLSLSLRLFGNIAGEHMTLVLVTQAVAFGIPLILHVLGLIPVFVQGLVFTLLTTSFIAGVIHVEHEEETAGAGERAMPVGRASEGPVTMEGETADAPLSGAGA